MLNSLGYLPFLELFVKSTSSFTVKIVFKVKYYFSALRNNSCVHSFVKTNVLVGLYCTGMFFHFSTDLIGKNVL